MQRQPRQGIQTVLGFFPRCTRFREEIGRDEALEVGCGVVGGAGDGEDAAGGEGFVASAPELAVFGCHGG